MKTRENIKSFYSNKITVCLFCVYFRCLIFFLGYHVMVNKVIYYIKYWNYIKLHKIIQCTLDLCVDYVCIAAVNW